MAKSNQALQVIRSQLHVGESMAYWIAATWTLGQDASGTVSGVLAVTDERVVFHGGLLWHKKDHSMPLDSITSIDLERGILAHITVLAAAGSMRYLANRHHARPWVAAANAQLTVNRHRPANQPTAPTGGSTADELTKLAALHHSGALTEGEFMTAKLRLLRS